jgi:hypothetical protein
MGDDGRGGSGVGGWRRVRHSGKSRSEASERQVDVARQNPAKPALVRRGEDLRQTLNESGENLPDSMRSEREYPDTMFPSFFA